MSTVASDSSPDLMSMAELTSFKVASSPTPASARRLIRAVAIEESMAARLPLPIPSLRMA